MTEPADRGDLTTPAEPITGSQRVAGYLLVGVAGGGVLILLAALLKAFSWVLHV